MGIQGFSPMSKVKILTKVFMSFGLVLFPPSLSNICTFSLFTVCCIPIILPLSSTVCFNTHNISPFSQHPCAFVYPAVSAILQSRKQLRRVKRSSFRPELRFPNDLCSASDPGILRPFQHAMSQNSVHLPEQTLDCTQPSPMMPCLSSEI